MSQVNTITRDRIVKITQRCLSDIFGNGTVEMLDMYLSIHNTRLENILDEPEMISKGLNAIFGNGAEIVKKEIIHSIAMELRIINTDMPFEEFIRKLDDMLK